MGIELHIKAARVPGGDVLADGEAQPEVATIAARGARDRQSSTNLQRCDPPVREPLSARTCWRANQQEETFHRNAKRRAAIVGLAG